MISIVIPTLSNIDGFKKCIDSIRNKSIAVNELIIIDNSWTKEQSKWILEQNVPYYLRIITAQEKLSVAVSWDSGIKTANNNIVAVVNDDVEILTNNWDMILIEEWNKYKNAAIMCPWPVSHETEHLGEGEAYDGLNGSFFVIKKDIIEKTDNYKNLDCYIDINYKKAYWEDVDLLKQVRDIGMTSYVSRSVKALHYSNTTAGKLYPAHCPDDPYRANLTYFNNKYGTQIYDYFKVFMSNLLDENSDRRLI